MKTAGSTLRGGFHTLLAAEAWMANRVAVAKDAAVAQEKLRRD
jgi:hypothetical protein